MNEEDIKKMYPQQYEELGIEALDNLASFYVIFSNERKAELEQKHVDIIRETYHNTKRRLPEKYIGLHQLADKIHAKLMEKNKR